MDKRYPAIILLLFTGLLVGCAPDQAPDDATRLQEEIAALEASFGESPNDSVALVLAEKCQVLAELVPDSLAAELQHKAAEALFYAKRYRSAADVLKHVLRDYPDAPNALQHALLLASIYDRYLKDTLQAAALEQCIAQAFAGTPKGDSLASITEGQPSVPERLKALGNDLYDLKNQKLNYHNAQAFVEISELYASLLPADTLSPLLLIRAAEVARVMKKFDKAIELYQWVLSQYPDHPDAADAMFMIAFTWDSDLAQYDSARVWYERFLRTYPDNDFADDARFLLENLGKSEEELLKSLEKKEEKQQ